MSFHVEQTLYHKLQWKLNKKENISLKKDTFKNVVCKIATTRWWMPLDQVFKATDGVECTSRGVEMAAICSNVGVLIGISVKFVRNDPLDSYSALVQTMAWHRTGTKPFLWPKHGLAYWRIYASLSLDQLMFYAVLLTRRDAVGNLYIDGDMALTWMLFYLLTKCLGRTCYKVWSTWLDHYRQVNMP